MHNAANDVADENSATTCAWSIVEHITANALQRTAAKATQYIKGKCWTNTDAAEVTAAKAHYKLNRHW